MNDPRSGSVTGGDTDADEYLAAVNGDEAVGGTTAVPGQNDTEELAEAAGITLDDGSPLDLQEMMQARDRQRWELEPDSASAD
jgi:hypothetical protein